jgi:hypothetical protein
VRLRRIFAPAWLTYLLLPADIGGDESSDLPRCASSGADEAVATEKMEAGSGIEFAVRTTSLCVSAPSVEGRRFSGGMEDSVEGGRVGMVEG